LLKSANQDGGCTWCSNEDITFTNNIVRNVEQGLTINGAEGQLPLPRQSTRIKIKNNLFENVSARLFQVYNGATHIQFENNTGYSKYSILFGNPGPNANLVFRNNIVERSTYGIGTGADEGKIYLDKWFSPYVFENNVVLNVSQGTSQQVSDETLLKRYPAGTEVVTGRNLTGIDKGIGADMDAINEATRWVATGAGTIANSAPVQTIVTPPTPVVSNPIPAPVTVTLPEQAAPQASSGSSNSSGRGGGGGGSSSSISNRSNAPAANSAIIMAIQVQLITLIQQLIVMLNQQIQAMHAGNNY
ncbi:MAG: hypothetical protein Q8O71_00040, partial [bacterium]|nr:hypothetical protein [bacterium]